MDNTMNCGVSCGVTDCVHNPDGMHCKAQQNPRWKHLQLRQRYLYLLRQFPKEMRGREGKPSLFLT